MHVNSAILAIALETNRQFVWHPTSEGTTMFTEPGCGYGSEHANFLCLFEPPSSCGFEYVTKENSETGKPDLVPGFDLVPTFLKERLRRELPGLTLRPEFLKFWWRAQGAAYLFRFNNHTYDKLAPMRLDASLHQGARIFPNGTKLDIPVPFPLPKGVIGSHVRHGDKFKEMKLIPFADYVKKAESFVSENPLKYKKIMFVSSEDEQVINETMSLSSIYSGINIELPSIHFLLIEKT
jgi:hypothetical protein